MIQLININDIITLKPMSVNTDVTKKLNFCIDEAQKYDVTPFLGDTLYILMEADSPLFLNPIYAKLFNGGDYVNSTETFRHGGIKSLLIYFAFARYVANSNVNHTAFGLVDKINEHSTGVSKDTLARQVNNATALANAELSKVEMFLRLNIADYPKWCGASSPTSPTGLRINAIGGNRQRVGSSYRCGNCGRYSCICNRY